METTTAEMTRQLPAMATKKKCTGKCDKCKMLRRQKKLNSLDAAISHPNNHINLNEMTGIEFEPVKHKLVWSGVFRGTRDF